METDGQRPEHRAPGTAWVLTAKVPCLRRVSASTQPVLRVPRGCSSRRESVGTAARTAPQLLRGPERPWTGTFGGGATTSPAGMEEPTDSSSVLGKSELHTVFRLRTAGDLNPGVFQGQRSKEVAARRCPQFGTVRGCTRGKSWCWRPAMPRAQGRGLSLCSSRARRCLSGTHPGARGAPVSPSAAASCSAGLRRATPRGCRRPAAPACAPSPSGTPCSPHPAPPAASVRTPAPPPSPAGGSARSGAVAGRAKADRSHPPRARGSRRRTAPPRPEDARKATALASG